jgi:hypothetical protein
MILYVFHAEGATIRHCRRRHRHHHIIIIIITFDILSFHWILPCSSHLVIGIFSKQLLYLDASLAILPLDIQTSFPFGSISNYPFDVININVAVYSLGLSPTTKFSFHDFCRTPLASSILCIA